MDFKKTIDLIEKNNQRVVLFCFIVFLSTGLFVFRDYGISWDEDYQWKDNGYANYNFIVHDDQETLLKGADKYHGPAFELVLVGFEKLFRLTDRRDIFFLRHLLTFLVFYVSSLFFYFLSLRIFKSWKVALLGFLFYVLSPHIFSHSFYNSKDIVFLSFFTIATYYLFSFLDKKTYWRAFLFAGITAYAIDIRVIGALIPIVFSFLIIIETLRKRILKESHEKQNWFPVISYFFFLIPFTILFWPVLWIDPLYHFMEALKENSQYPWSAPVLYFGEQYKPTMLPWHYIFFWMFISRPVIYSFFFIAGVLVVCGRFVSNPLSFILKNTNEQVVLCWFFLPLIAMFVFKSPAFDTGRHLYFLHGAFVLLSLFGASALWRFIKKKKVLIFVFSGALSISFFVVSMNMTYLHPYQHLYFNETQNDLEVQKRNFEFDYWGLAARDILENLARIDTSANIRIQAENEPGVLNSYLLLRADRARIKYSKYFEGAEYFIADYRWQPAGAYEFKNEVYSKMIGNTRIATLFRLRLPEELYHSKSSRQLLTFEHDFETKKNEWTNNNTIQLLSGAHSGVSASVVDSTSEYSDAFVINDLDKLAGNNAPIVKSSFWIYDAEPNSKWKFVFCMENLEGKTYFWKPINEQLNDSTKGNPYWKQLIGAIEIPVIKNPKDKIKIYLLNLGKKRVLIDDVKINFEEEILLTGLNGK